jgi:serine/threonine protein kinase
MKSLCLGKQVVQEGETVSTDPTAASGAGDSDDATHTFAAPAARGDLEIERRHNMLADAAGAEIGPYKIVRQLGEGGMGAVYLASQLHPIRRDVALKIIKPGMDSRQVISRFESER